MLHYYMDIIRILIFVCLVYQGICLHTWLLGKKGRVISIHCRMGNSKWEWMEQCWVHTARANVCPVFCQPPWFLEQEQPGVTLAPCHISTRLLITYTQHKYHPSHRECALGTANFSFKTVRAAAPGPGISWGWSGLSLQLTYSWHKFRYKTAAC